MNLKISSEVIKKTALEAGFTYCGISNIVDFSKEVAYFKESIQNGFHAKMGYLERNIEERFAIDTLLPHCKSVIVTLFNYHIDQKIDSKYRISRYAFVKDYHQLIPELLEKMVVYLQQKHEPFNYKISVDSGRISEKNWAVKSGLGYYGKNGVLLTTKGSFYFIWLILFEKELD